MKTKFTKITVLCLSLLSMSLSLIGQTNVLSGFVYAEGDKFMLDRKPFYFSGVNVYDFLRTVHQVEIRKLNLWIRIVSINI